MDLPNKHGHHVLSGENVSQYLPENEDTRAGICRDGWEGVRKWSDGHKEILEGGQVRYIFELKQLKEINPVFIWKYERHIYNS